MDRSDVERLSRTGNPLLEACREVMSNAEVRSSYPKGLMAKDILAEIRRKYPDAFPFVDVLDVVNEMTAFYGPGRNG